MLHEMLHHVDFTEVPHILLGGDLTKQEAEESWTKMSADPQYIKRGKKIAIPIHEDVVDFGEFSKARKIEAEQKLSNKLTEQDLGNKIQNIVLSGDGALAKSLDVANIAQGLVTQADDEDETDNPASSMFAGDLALPDLRKMASGRRASFGSKASQSSKPTAGSDDEDDSEDSDDSDSHDSQSASAAKRRKTNKDGADAKGPKGKDKDNKTTKWFDVSTEKAKADRQLRDLKTKAEQRLRTQLSSMGNQVDLSRASSVSMVELQIAVSRQKALQIIVNDSAEAFKTYCSDLSKLLAF